MKSALLAAIFGITGMVAILLAVPAEEKAPVFIIHPPKWLPDYGDPMVVQIEEVAPQEVLVPEPLDHYSVAQAKTEKPAPRRHMHVVRPRPNFIEKLVAGFIKLQNLRLRNHLLNGLVQPRGAAEKKELSAHRRIASLFNCSHGALICVDDEAGNVIETHEDGDLNE